MIIVAAAQSSTDASISIVVWVLVLVALLVPLAAATLWLRRWAHQDAGGRPAEGFTLNDVQEMLKRGELSQAQYERVRQEIIAQSKQILDAKIEPDESKPDKKPGKKP